MKVALQWLAVLSIFAAGVHMQPDNPEGDDYYYEYPDYYYDYAEGEEGNSSNSNAENPDDGDYYYDYGDYYYDTTPAAPNSTRSSKPTTTTTKTAKTVSPDYYNYYDTSTTENFEPTTARSSKRTTTSSSKRTTTKTAKTVSPDKDKPFGGNDDYYSISTTETFEPTATRSSKRTTTSSSKPTTTKTAKTLSPDKDEPFGGNDDYYSTETFEPTATRSSKRTTTSSSKPTTTTTKTAATEEYVITTDIIFKTESLEPTAAVTTTTPSKPTTTATETVEPFPETTETTSTTLAPPNEPSTDFSNTPITTTTYSTTTTTIVDDTVPGFNSSFIWPGGEVPYVIHDLLSGIYEKGIEQNMKTLNEKLHGCIHFRPKTSADLHYISFVRTEDVCRSRFIGKAKFPVGSSYHYTGFEQHIYLGTHCATPRYVFWVLLQVLGLPAEHMRPDRDEYIEIKWENVDPEHANAFKKYAFIDPKLARLPYEYESRLHYASDKFSVRRGAKTIVDTRTGGEMKLGNLVGPTPLDYAKVAALYCPNGELPNNGNPDVIYAPEGVPVGLLPFRSPSAAVAAKQRRLHAKCKCKHRQNAEGSCDISNGIMFQRMVGRCLNDTQAEICQCHDISVHPCWCQPVSNGRCQKRCRQFV